MRFDARELAPGPRHRLPRACLGIALCVLPFASSVADTVEERLERRDFPSVFQAWSPVENVPGEGELDGVARHDLYWRSLEAYGLQWEDPDAPGSPAVDRGLATSFVPPSVAKARTKRRKLLARNPDLVLLAELRYRDGPPGFLPVDHPWWLRDANGERVPGWPEGGSYRLDLNDADFIANTVERARALVDTGAVDGLILDVWNEFESPYQDARAALVQGVRAAIGEALIVVNTNDIRAPRSAPYVNGLYMENGSRRDAAIWSEYRDIMDWASANLRKPSFTAFETWYDVSRQSPADLRQMRATTALSLVGSGGFVLFGDPNPLPTSDHLHDWYPFWDVELGRPAGPAVDLVGGAVRRNYTNGVAVYSPPGGDTGTVTFDRRVRSVNTGRVATSHPMAALDGDLFLYTEAAPAAGARATASVGDFAPPKRLGAGGRTVVFVPYETDAATDVIVSLQDTGDAWKTVGFARKRVRAGTRTLRVPVGIATDAVAGDDYAWTAWLAPPGGDWPARLDARTVEGVTVGAADASDGWRRAP